MKGPSSLITVLIITLTGMVLSNCTTALPEFQNAASLAPREHHLALGGFSGSGLNASTGGIAVYNYGLTQQLDFTSNLSASRLNIEQNNIRITTLAGAKWSSASNKWALSLPIGLSYSKTYNDIDAGYTYLLTPTLYKSWNYGNPNSTSTFFARSEFAYNYIRGRWYSVVGGYSQEIHTNQFIHYLSVSGSTNGPFYGVYFGYGLSLKALR